MIMLITVESNTKEAVLINAGLQAGRSGPEQEAQEGWVLQGWNCCRRSVSLHKHHMDPSLPASWLVSGLSASQNEEGMRLAKLFSLFLYTLPHQTPFLGGVFLSVRHCVKRRRDLNGLSDYRNSGLQMNSITVLMLIPTVVL